MYSGVMRLVIQLSVPTSWNARDSMGETAITYALAFCSAEIKGLVVLSPIHRQ